MIALFVNRRARVGRTDPGLPDRLRAQLGARGELFVTEDPAELAALAVRVRDGGFDTVGLVGGDGTGSLVLTALAAAYGDRSLPTVALLRGGTVNTVAGNFGQRGTPERLLRRLLATPTPRTIENDTLRVNGQVGFLFGAAMGGRFLEAYYESNPQTAWDAATMAARTLGSIFVWGKLARRMFAVTPLQLAVDGRATAITRPRLLVAATVPDMGVGFKVAWQARTVPGQLHVVASELTMFGMGSQSWRTWLQRPLKGGPHLDVLCRAAEVEFASEEPYTLDGDLYRTRRVTIGLGPRLRIVQ